jgi:hypothetical protein
MRGALKAPLKQNHFKELGSMVLKAKRTYKEEVAKKVTKADKALTDAYTKDMEKAKLNGAYQKQIEEFGTFLTEASKKTKPFQFLLDMKAKHDEGAVFTDNMANAVRKCMEREKEWTKQNEEKKKASEAGNYPTITLKIKPFLMKSLGIDSRIITGKVKAESAKAWLVEGYADMLTDMTFCARCSKQLTEPASMVTGFGATCADRLGIPYDPAGVLGMSKAERKKVRQQFVKKLNNQKFERWIPKSQAEVFEQ